MKTAIFLGAGASAAEGAPIQNQLFSEYFKNHDHSQRTGDDMYGRIRSFFLNMFDIDVTKSKNELENVNFPTFEEVLGTLDLASQRKEAFRFMSGIDVSSRSGELEQMRLAVILLMAKIIRDKLVTINGHHSTLLNNLSQQIENKEVFFISANYDIVVDNALINVFNGNRINYGIDFEGDYVSGNRLVTMLDGIELYKIHGSLNWLYCPSCNVVWHTSKVKGVTDLVEAMDGNEYRGRCGKCGNTMSPIIVPPSYYKDFNSVYLSTIWAKVEKALLETDHIVFCGYSFPDSDVHIKYILKRAQKNRLTSSGLKVSVVNHYDGKNEIHSEQEKERYERYLGAHVNYTKLDFQSFAKNPAQLIN